MNMTGVTSWDIVFRNILRKPDGTVILCDLAKLYKSDFPEEPIVRYILNNIYYSNDWKLAFIEGYNRYRLLTLKGLLEKEIEVNYDKYQDLYLNDELLCNGVRSNKRLSMITDNFGGKDILDIGCSSGMISRYAARSGAHAICGVEKLVRSRTRNMVDLAAYLAYLEGLSIQFIPMDCEHDYFISKVKDVKWDIIFFLAMVGHLKGDRVKYVKWLKSLTKVLYFETNLGGDMVQAELFLNEVGFSKIECLGESGDPDRDPNSHYILYRCETGKE
jgi:2-polyprenyl-3-methyl-5-hydroxy-6-metoxy-1,4-benzoquinol methylase